MTLAMVHSFSFCYHGYYHQLANRLIPTEKISVNDRFSVKEHAFVLASSKIPDFSDEPLPKR